MAPGLLIKPPPEYYVLPAGTGSAMSSVAAASSSFTSSASAFSYSQSTWSNENGMSNNGAQNKLHTSHTYIISIVVLLGVITAIGSISRRRYGNPRNPQPPMVDSNGLGASRLKQPKFYERYTGHTATESWIYTTVHHQFFFCAALDAGTHHVAR